MIELTEHEIQILEEVAGIRPISRWNALVGASLEALYGNGFITAPLCGKITQKGKDYLAAVAAAGEAVR